MTLQKWECMQLVVTVDKDRWAWTSPDGTVMDYRDALDHAGANGWEAVTMATVVDNQAWLISVLYLFKRPIEQPDG
jgi:hypothetical protein